MASTTTNLATSSSFGVTAFAKHPTYATFEAIWRKLSHVAEGTGGFLDGSYLIGHPREYTDFRSTSPSTPNKKLKQRQLLARYENPARPILQTISGVLFREPPYRKVGEGDDPHPLAQWWEDVDGSGTTIDEFWQMAWMGAAIFGHVFVVMDRPAAPAPTAADAASPFLRVYTPLDVPDWLVDDRGALTAVRLSEALPRTSFQQASETPVIREITPEGWTVTAVGTGNRAAGVLEGGTHDYAGALPVVILYSKRRALTPIVGESVLGDPQLYIDVYNQTSEIREIQRNQTFSILNAPLGQGQDALSVEQAKALLGEQTGTENVLFSGLPLQYVSPDAAQLQVYQTERDSLLRTIYRLAAVPWEGDSRDAESADSRKVKRDDFYATIANYAQELERADYAIAELWMRATYGQAWEREWDKLELAIQYPVSFDSTTQTDLEQATLALALNLPKPALDAIKKALIPKLLPSLSAEEIAEINEAIEEQPDQEDLDVQERQARIADLAGGAAPQTQAEGQDAKEEEGEDG